MRRTGPIIIAALALAGCASHITVPVTGQISGGVPASGSATGRADGTGTIMVEAKGGPRCEGAYDPFDTSAVITVPITCDNGVSGTAVISRRPDLVTGSAVVTLSDGTRGQFVYGDGMVYDQVFSPTPLPPVTPSRRSPSARPAT